MKQKKIMGFGFLVTLFAFTFIVSTVYGYSGTVSVNGTISVNDSRVNPSDPITWTIPEIYNGTSDNYVQNGWAMDFDQVGDSVSVASAASINFGQNDFSVFAWVKTSEPLGANNPVMGKYPNGANTGAWDMNINDAGQADFLVRANTTDGTYSRVIVAGPWNDGDWHLLGFTRSDSTVNGYIDGTYRGTNAGLVSGANVDNAENLWY